MKRALAILLCSLPAYAEPPFLPIADCKGDVCTMSRADFEKFQQFHAAVYAQAAVMEEHAEVVARENSSLRQKLSENLHCQLRKL